MRYGRYLLLLLAAAFLIALPLPASAEMKEVSVMIWDCDTPFSTGTLDTETKTQGAGSVSFLLDGFSVHALTDVLVDISAADTLEFDVWVSDVRFFSLPVSGQFELTSSGTCDVNEMSFDYSYLHDYTTDGAPKVGWNHIRIPFLKAHETGDKADLTKINFMRWYFVPQDGADLSPFITFKLDNVRATNYFALEQDKIRDTVLPTIEKITAIGDVGTVTKKSYDRIKAQVDEAAEEYDALTEIQKSVIDADTYRVLTNAQKELRIFELKLERGIAPEGEDETEPPETAYPGGDVPETGETAQVTEYNEPLIFAVTFALILLISVTAFFVIKKKEGKVPAASDGTGDLTKKD